uniref:Bm160 n=1 Tax=Brugia malayi TaxID=6279 RepID=A0A0J9XMU2_BRUMA|nr:Bm160 [Brugia malayi]
MRVQRFRQERVTESISEAIKNDSIRLVKRERERERGREEEEYNRKFLIDHYSAYKFLFV